MNPSSFQSPFFLQCIIVIFSVFFLCAGAEGAGRDYKNSSEETVRLSDVIDGDTVQLKDGRVVRLVGVDCPEMYDKQVNQASAARLDVSYMKQEIFAQKAADYVRKSFSGKELRLVREPAYDVLEHEDRSGRDLAYLYDGDLLINLDLIQKGYCAVYPKMEFRYRREFLEAERKARSAGSGLWKDN